MRFLKQQTRDWGDTIPQTWPCNHLKEPGVEGFFYESINNTRVFAWLGLPENCPTDQSVPGIILVHGGLGTAFSHWVRFWNQRGYAALAMDTCGAMPIPGNPIAAPAQGWPRHSYSGAAGWGAFEQGELHPEKQWFTHALAAIHYGHTILSNHPGVDAKRIGITGVSWGGVLTAIAAGIDNRYRAAASVYGCGYRLQSNPKSFAKLSNSAINWWKNEWDPAVHLPYVDIPILFFNGTNDFTFLPPEWQRSTELPQNIVERCLKLRWPHGHGAISEEQPEICAFFDEYMLNVSRRIKLGKTQIAETQFIVPYSYGEPVISQLAVTFDSESNWPEREWYLYPAEIQRDKAQISAKLPKGWQAAFISVITPERHYITAEVIFAK